MMDAKKIKKLSAKQEERTAKDLGGRVQPGSGNKDGAKGDGITGRATIGLNPNDFLFENKFTFDHKYQLKLETWKKVAGEALRENMRVPLMQIDIGHHSLMQVELVVIAHNDFVALELEPFFILEKKRKTDKKSILLQGPVLYNRIMESPLYREDILFDSEKLRLVVVPYANFKYALSTLRERNS